MKRKLHFLLAVSIGLTASVGWLHAENETHHVFHVGTIANKTGDVAGLRDSIAKAADGDTIKLASVIYLLDEQLVIDKGIVLEGIIGSSDATIIKANRDAEWPKKTDGSIDNSKTNLISIVGGAAEKSVTLKNLAVYNSMASGINAQSAMKTCLEGVIIDGSMNAGLLVHSAVEVKSLKTLGNGWGSVNVDKGTSDYTPNFKFTDGNFLAYEPYKIWTELTTTENVVTLPEKSNWATYTIKESDKEKTKKYWTTSDLSMEYVENFPRNKNLTNGYTFVYAAGAPITVAASANSGFVTILNNTTGTQLELPEKCNPVIFGGSKEALDKNTSITMESGKVFALIGGGYKAKVNDVALTVNGGTIRQYLVGGGFGPNDSKENAKSADATAVTMNVNGASVGYLISGGMEFAKTESTNVTVNGATLTYALGGGFAPVGFGQTENTDSKDYLNSIGTSTFSMTGGTVTGASCAGGGYSYSAMGTANATYNKVTFNGGLYGAGWRGYTKSSTVTANGCTFNSRTGDYRTIAAMVRGKAENISMTFDDKCIFDAKYECYLGTDRDSEQKNPIPTSDNITITFKGTNTPIVNVSNGMQNVTVTGAKVNLVPFLWKASTPNDLVKDFTIPANKTWTFNDGLSMASGVTLTKTGTLKYGKSFDANVSTFAEMQTAVDMIKEGVDNEITTSVITLEKDLTFDSNTKLMGGAGDYQGLFFLKSAKMKNLALTIAGNGKTISGKKYNNTNSSNDGGKKYLFYIEGNDVTSTLTIKDLTMKEMDVVGINAYNFPGLLFNNVAMNGNLEGAVHLNSSALSATDFTTSGNKKFAVKLSSETTNYPHIELGDGCMLNDKAGEDEDFVPQIAFYDRVSNSLKGTYCTSVEVAKMVVGSYGEKLTRSWAKAKYLHTDNNTPLVRVWTSNLATEYISNSETIQLDSISSGLDSLLIDTDFATVAGVMNTGVKYATFNKNFTASALRNGLIINCEDAYLVTGKDDAAAFSEVAKNKPVKRLTLADNKLAVVSAFSAPVIEDKQSWNDAKYAEQNVTITEKGILNINVAMALDTVFMEEGAQLKVLPNTAVTAKAVQLTYKVTDQWKAFGFPFNKMGNSKTMTVKDAKGTDVKTATGNFGTTGETGLWGASVKASAVEFEMKAANATPDSACLIACDNADSLIYVTSPADVVVSLGTKEAPVSVGDLKSGNPTLKMCANPNLYKMQLTGYAYIFDAAKNVFTQQFNPAIAPFQSYILADETTTSTLRSLRVGETPTGNETITPAEGYYVESGHGTITIRTAEPVQVVVADMLGRIYYNARVTSDGYQINLPAGIYAVNKQKVIVK
ncbi:DUF6383 domain-containing protein [uncultured Parabacteroides sp.]|uniref:DUF6383 domain-containing protein n=1 Tax=uncultured Parabacteroides sp. TaxID=512312 RepID=UPI0026018C72|nr:DUF6383 domain-containing protein [uncultured Parabacteroides sp.]